MSAVENKQMIESMLAGTVGWLEQWASDGVWIIPGSSRWSGAYRGRAAIGMKLLGPLTSELESLGTFEVENVIAEGNFVVVQGHATGRVTKVASLTTTPTASCTRLSAEKSRS